MAFIPLPDGARLQLVYSDGTNTSTNTLHVTRTDWAEPDMAILVAAIRTALFGLTTKPWAGAYQFKEIRVYDLRAEDAPVYTYALTPVGGSSSGEICDKASAVVWTFRTSTRGRSGRGRWYIGGQAEGNIQGGLWTAAHLTNIGLMVNAIMAAVNNSGFTAVICSREHNGQPRTTAAAYAITSGLSRSNIPGSQDRRNKRP